MPTDGRDYKLEGGDLDTKAAGCERGKVGEERWLTGASIPIAVSNFEDHKKRPSDFSEGLLKSLNFNDIFGGVDGARTRDPRRDRPVF